MSYIVRHQWLHWWFMLEWGNLCRQNSRVRMSMSCTFYRTKVWKFSRR